MTTAAIIAAAYLAGIATGIAALLIISAHLTPSNGHDAAAKAKRAARK